MQKGGERMPIQRPSTPPRRRHPRRGIHHLVSLTGLVVAVVLWPATATADTEIDSGPACLWAGIAYSQNVTVTAGGGDYTCETDSRGLPSWTPRASDHPARVVFNPGATASPIGQFSNGARQPGTAYNDYCVGSQLIEGAEDIYTVVTDSSGFSFWKAVAPISRWRFSTHDIVPERTWRSSSMCYDGVLS